MINEGRDLIFIVSRLTNQVGQPLYEAANPHLFGFYRERAGTASGFDRPLVGAIGRFATATSDIFDCRQETQISILGEVAGMMPEHYEHGRLLGSISVKVVKAGRASSPKPVLNMQNNFYSSGVVELAAADLLADKTGKGERAAAGGLIASLGLNHLFEDVTKYRHQSPPVTHLNPVQIRALQQHVIREVR